MIRNRIMLHNDVTNAQTSKIVSVNNNTELSIEVSGTGVFAIELQGKTSDRAEWTPIGCINLTTFASGTTMSSNGVYSAGISGIASVRTEIKNVTGKVTVVATLIS